MFINTDVYLTQKSLVHNTQKKQNSRTWQAHKKKQQNKKEATSQGVEERDHGALPEFLGYLTT